MLHKQQVPKATSFRTFKPTKAQEQIITDGLSFLNMTAPFWSTILYRELRIVYTHDVPWAATDANSIYVNPDGMKQSGWTVENVAFVLAHEVMHYVLDDLMMNVAWMALGHVIIDNVGGTLPLDHEIMNIALDYRINAMLIDGKIGTMPKEGFYDKAISLAGHESAISIYAKLWKQKQGGGAPGQGQPGGGGGDGFDIHLEPTEQDKKDHQHGISGPIKAQAIQAALQAAEAAGMGKLPGAMQHLIGEILDPKVKWQDHLKATMQRSAGEPRHDWSKVNKRLISRPEKVVFARKGNFGCGTIVIGWDSSGSMLSFQDLIFSEMAGIVADLNPAELIVLRCDTQVHNADTLEEPSDLHEYRDMVNDEGIGGGGGTSFVPFFDWIKDNHVEPDMLVVLTDTYGTFPSEEPSYPTIWGSIVPGAQVPFGTLIEIEKE